MKNEYKNILHKSFQAFFFVENARVDYSNLKMFILNICKKFKFVDADTKYYKLFYIIILINHKMT